MTGRDRDRPKLIPRDPPLVTVRFRDGIDLTRGTQATSEVRDRQDARWRDLEEMFPRIALAPLFGRQAATFDLGQLGLGLRGAPGLPPRGRGAQPGVIAGATAAAVGER